MNTITHCSKTKVVLPLIASLILLSGCSDSSSSDQPDVPEFEPDTSYLDDLAPEESTQPAEEELESEDIALESEPEPSYEDEEREWVKDEGSKSTLGRARDRARSLGEDAQDSTRPSNGLADTAFDEEYAQAAGFAWDMNEDWRMAIPSDGLFAEMYVQNPLGNASIAFSKVTESANNVKRSLESTITDMMTGRSYARESSLTVMGYPVTIFDLKGTYIDPGAKSTSNGSPFYAIHAAYIELPTTKILIKLWGPEQTVERTIHDFDTMIKNMYKK